jgi:hypothetical protein
MACDLCSDGFDLYTPMEKDDAGKLRPGLFPMESAEKLFETIKKELMRFSGTG